MSKTTDQMTAMGGKVAILSYLLAWLTVSLHLGKFNELLYTNVTKLQCLRRKVVQDKAGCVKSDSKTST
jgi:hypothetical protein